MKNALITAGLVAVIYVGVFGYAYGGDCKSNPFTGSPAGNVKCKAVYNTNGLWVPPDGKSRKDVVKQQVSKDPAADIRAMVADNVSSALIVSNGKTLGNIALTAGGKDICMIVNIGNMKVDDLLKDLGIKNGSNRKLKWTPAP